MLEKAPDTTAKALQHVRATTTPPRRYLIFGERCSGTNFLQQVLHRRLRLRNWTRDIWKHGFPTFYGVPSDVVVFVLMRNAVDWSKSLYSRPWHSAPELRDLSYSEFIRSEWNATVDRTFMGGRFQRTPVRDALLQHDRHPVTGQPFSNIFEMRQAKAQAWLGCLNRDINTVVLTHETLSADIEGTASLISAAFDVPVKPGQPDLSRSMGYHDDWGHRELKAPEKMSQTDLAFIQEATDPELEGVFGYRY